LSYIFVSEACIKLVAHRINPHARSRSQPRGWWSMTYISNWYPML